MQELILLTLKQRDERVLVVTFAPPARAVLYAWTPMQAELLELVGGPLSLLTREQLQASPHAALSTSKLAQLTQLYP